MSLLLTLTGARDLLEQGVERLVAAGLQTARQDAEWLLGAALGGGRYRGYLDGGSALSAVAAARYHALVARRSAHEPLQHLLGHEEFHGLRLRVTPDVLIPRPETEGLVDWVIEKLTGLAAPRAADVGTGSGAIACAVAAALPAARVVGIDTSSPALAVAAHNVRALGLRGRVALVAGDLLAPVRSRPLFDLVVANVPYLPTGVLPFLPREVAGFEPRLALDGGPDGMRLIRRLVAEAPAVLRPGGVILLEVGEEQAGPVASLLAAEGFESAEARRDLRDVERHVGARWPGPASTAGPGSRLLRRAAPIGRGGCC